MAEVWNHGADEIKSGLMAVRRFRRRTVPDGKRNDHPAVVPAAEFLSAGGRGLNGGHSRLNAIAQGGAWSPRVDIAPPPGLAPLAELNVASGFLAFITRTANAQAYRDRFAALIGQVTGPEYR